MQFVKLEPSYQGMGTEKGISFQIQPSSIQQLFRDLITGREYFRGRGVGDFIY